MQSTMHIYEVRPRKDKRGVDLISEALPFGALWYAGPKRRRQRNRIRGAFQSITSRRDLRLHDGGNVIETHEHKGDFKEC